MVKFNRFTLDNGLRVLVHEDTATPMAVVNILYDVGARDEHPDQTGFAHLFEHLMFGGSVNIPSYDGPSQAVGAQNNAFTSNDITNYYITLPAANLETAFWLESDRMLSLAFNEKSLDVQRNVVCEEFKQRYLNQPYGDVWLRLRPLAYQVHPYRWATIGKELSHIEQAQMDDVKAFFARYYVPENAILVVAGNVETDRVKQLAEKWFGPITSRSKYLRQLPAEPEQQEARREVVYADVPLNSLYIAFHGPARLEDGYYAMDLLSDLLSRGTSSRLYRILVKEKELFSEINAYHTGSIDGNLFVVEGKPLPNVTLEVAEEAIWNELNRLKTEPVTDYELDKVKNRIESTMVFAEMAILEKAMNLAYFELLGDANGLNREIDHYFVVSPDDIQQQAGRLFRKENSSTLIYITDKYA
ncbi:M16 family metallopeptidase [Parapedobacter indicus]|uniref:Predicted Zn-dependent peptidase n=1 Tax=Parapedobacter indicus TaxID=1477437 RepID=A0A1I3DXG2_9SPHI|nr:pitrilysin family protein [Parapedobacter indicus]PPL04880.1 putative Zn-dependent peptidase [Parapedobacter indicus]SFH91375.1 Predicted Zn-dependent peptidase [Parapedobacter indicus]